MQRNIITELEGKFSPEFIKKAALALKESESGVSRGLKNLVPSILFQLNHQLNRSDANQLFQLLKNEDNITFNNQLDGLLKNENSTLTRKNIVGGFIKKLFGDQQERILDFVSQRNQLKTRSSQSLMTIAGALVMGNLSQLIRKDGLKLNSLRSFLSGQQDHIEADLPAGITNWLGTIRPLATAGSSSAAGTTAVAYSSGSTAANAVSDEAVAAGPSSSVAKYLLPLLLLLVLFFGGKYFLNSSSTPIKAEPISQANNNTPAKSVVVKEALEEVDKDELIAATLEQALDNKIETSNKTPKTSSSSISNNNTVTSGSKIIKKKSIESVTISEPQLIEEVNIEATSSPGEVVSNVNMSSKGGENYNKTNTNVTSSGTSSVVFVNTKPKAVKVKYEDYIGKVKMPETGQIASSKIERKISDVRPEWYTSSKEVVGGNSSHVTIIKKTETSFPGRNTTSDALSELRKSLSLTTYNAWFGHITNPISSTEYRLYNHISGKIKSTNAIDKYTWFNLDKVSFPNYDSRMDYNESKGQLGRIANILSTNPNVTLKIGGFTSDLGKKRANRKLSLEMAKQTKAALVKLGVDESRISVKGYGESNPLGLNDTEQGRMKNHRVGFRVMSK